MRLGQALRQRRERLGLEVALVPIGQSKPLLSGLEPTGQPSQVLDLLAECNDLVDGV